MDVLDLHAGSYISFWQPHIDKTDYKFYLHNSFY